MENTKICSKCKEEKDVNKFRHRLKTALKLTLNSWCRCCENKENAKRFIPKEKKYLTADEIAIRKELKTMADKKRMLLHRYNLSYDDYLNMYSSQNKKCKICDEPRKLGGKDGLYVDHCHKTNKVRGLLCPQCNTLLGRFKDDVIYFENAIYYLKT